MATSPRPWVASYPGFKTPGGGGGSSGNGSGLVCPKCSFPVTLVPLNEGILSIEVRFDNSNCPVQSVFAEQLHAISMARFNSDVGCTHAHYPSLQVLNLVMITVQSDGS